MSQFDNYSNINGSRPSISTILPISENSNSGTEETPEEIVQKRINMIPHNSKVWAVSRFFEVNNNEGSIEEREWDIDDIFDRRRPNKNSKFFFQDEFKQLNGKDNKLRCILCGFECNYYSTSPSCPLMENHIAKNHPNFSGNKTLAKRKEYGSCSSSGDEFTRKSNVLLTAFIVTSYSSFNVVSNEYFRNLINHLNNQYVIPGRTSLSETLLNNYVSKAKELILKEIESIDNCIATIDGWECKKTKQNFFSFTLHYIKNKRLIGRVLRLSKTIESHTAENISEFIEETIKE